MCAVELEWPDIIASTIYSSRAASLSPVLYNTAFIGLCLGSSVVQNGHLMGAITIMTQPNTYASGNSATSIQNTKASSPVTLAAGNPFLSPLSVSLSPLCVTLSLCLSLCLFRSVSLFRSVFLFLSLFLSVSISLSLSLSLSLFLSVASCL